MNEHGLVLGYTWPSVYKAPLNKLQLARQISETII